MKDIVKVQPSLITLVFILFVCAGVWVARTYGAIPAYIGFAWLIPLASFVWLKWGEGELGFGTSNLNVPFVMGVIGISVLLFFCFPLIIGMNRDHLSALTVVGLIISALLHGFAFLFYVLVYLSVLIFGK